MSDLVAIRDRARFNGPTLRSGTVKRARLDDRFASATGQVLRVLAPAGYGKSTQVLRWVVDDERRVRWLDLEPIDNDPLVLAHVIATGLADRPWSDLGVDDDVPFAGVAQLMADPDEPFVLVLDDVHHITSAESAGLIDLMIDHLPSHSTLVLVGRAHHGSESLARQRLEPGVVDVTAGDLAFDFAETEQMLTTLGLEADIDLLGALGDQFEGWPAGLRLAGQVMATRPGGFDVPLHKLGDLAYVTDYVTQEWFGALSPDDQTMLTELGCLERFSGAKCDAVLGRSDSASALRRLCHDELMLVGLDQHDEWFRMHAVLARWLSSRLQSSDNERWCEIHVAAARWWLDEGDPDLAIAHAAAAQDLDLLESVVVRRCGPYAARGMYRTIERWLGYVGESRMRESLPLMQVQAVLDIGAGDGDRALAWARRCRTDPMAADGVAADIADVLALQTDALLATLENRPACELVPVAERSYQRLRQSEWRSLACLVLGAQTYLSGGDGVIDLLREALFESEVAHTTTMQATVAASLAIVLDIEGASGEAAALSDRAVSLLATPLGKDVSATAVSLAIASLVDARAGRHEEAAARRDAGRLKLAGFDHSAPWFGILGLIPLIRTSLLLDDAPAALEMLAALDAKMQRQDRTTALARHIDDLRAAVHAATDAFTGRSWALTAAELRVVQYLPTNLSLGDIAGRLYVSRNTVKSHAAAIYRKLGTTSRSDAVERARAAGLITEAPPGT